MFFSLSKRQPLKLIPQTLTKTDTERWNLRMRERWVYWIILKSSFQWSGFYSPEVQSVLRNKLTGTGHLELKCPQGVGTSTNEDPVHAVLLRNSERECENVLWGYDKNSRSSLWASQKSLKETTRRKHLLELFGKELSGKQYSTACAISVIVRYVTTWSRGLMPIGQDLQANLCHACACWPESRGGGGRSPTHALCWGRILAGMTGILFSPATALGQVASNPKGQRLRDNVQPLKMFILRSVWWIPMRSNRWRRGLHICKDREWTAFVLKGIPDTSPVLTLHLKHAEYMSEGYATIQGGLCCEKRDASHSIDHLASLQAAKGLVLDRGHTRHFQCNGSYSLLISSC